MSKIGIDIRMLGTRHGGIGRYVSELVLHLLQLDKENQYFLFYNYKAVQEADLAVLQSHKNVRLVKTGINHYSLAEQLSLPKLLYKLDLDLVHFPNFNAPIFYQKPFVTTIHDVVHHQLGGGSKRRLVHFLAYQKVIAASVGKARKIITVSQAAVEEIKKYFKIEASKITVIYEGSSLKADVEPGQVLAVKNKFLLPRPYFLFVGVLERKKNLVNLTGGFDQFLGTGGPNMDLVIVGKADRHYPDIRQQAMDIKHKDNLVFTDFVEDEDLKALYQGAFAYVSASLHEGYGLPGVEAMAFGLPLVVADTAVFNEIYDDAAVYFDGQNPRDIADKLRFVVKDELYCQKLRKASLRRSKIFSWKTAAEQTLGVYKDCLNAKITV
jgi:glycosyltransferase involved in cell wall biosynthesis